MKIVQPAAFLLAETRLNSPYAPATPNDDSVDGYLAHLGVPDWQSDATSEAEELLEIAGKSCYLSFSTDLNKNLTRVGTRSNHDYLQEGIIGNKHGSVLEHASVTIALVNVSRIVTHELIRHRAGAAYSQESGRYVRKAEVELYLPPEIAENGQAVEVFLCAAAQAERNLKDLEAIYGIDEMKDFGLKKKLTSAFRRIMPEGRANTIVFTYNHRTMRHVLEMRTSRHAEIEIRLAFNRVYELLRDRFKAIYADARVQDVDGAFEITFEHEKV